MNIDYHDMDSLRNGDRQWFAAVYNHYFQRLFNYALGITRDEAMAEDAVADIFMRLWENHASVVIESSLQAYLFKSVYNACVNMLKHNDIRNKYRDFFLHHFSEEGDASDYPLAQVMERDISEIVDRTLTKLPEQCRLIFTMSRMEGLSHDEIAKKLKISVNTIKTQINRALKIMSVALRDYIAD